MRELGKPMKRIDATSTTDLEQLEKVSFAVPSIPANILETSCAGAVELKLTSVQALKFAMKGPN